MTACNGRLSAGQSPPLSPANYADWKKMSTSFLCFITAMAGALRPALRAARVDPIMALRGDT